MKRISKRFVSFLLAFVICFSQGLTASAAGPEIPYGGDIKAYDPGVNGYYALLPTSYQADSGQSSSGSPYSMQDIYLPVLVYENRVYVRPEDMALISGLECRDTGKGICLSVFERRLYMAVGERKALFEQGSGFARLEISLSAAPVLVNEEKWIPLYDVAVMFDLNASVQPEDSEDSRFVIFRAKRDALDVLADLAVGLDKWEFSFDVNMLSYTGSATVTYMDGLLNFDGTSWKMLMKEMFFADLWGGFFGMDSTMDDWTQKLTDELVETILLTGNDEAFVAATESYSTISEIMTLVQFGEEVGSGAAADILSSQMIKDLKDLGKKTDMPRAKKMAELIGNIESPDNEVFLDKVNGAVGLSLTGLSALFGIIGNVKAFDTRDQVAQEGLQILAQKSTFVYLDEVAADRVKSHLNEYKKSAVGYALGKYARENGLSVLGDILSVSNPLLSVYRLGSVLNKNWKKNLDATRSFQLCTLAMPLQRDAWIVMNDCVDRLNGASFSQTEIRTALSVAYMYLKTCYTATRLGVESVTDQSFDTSFLNDRAQRILEEMALLLPAYNRANSGDLPDNYNWRARSLLSGCPFNLTGICEKMYMTVYGKVLEEGTEKAIPDGNCEIKVDDVLCGTFEGTPSGQYEVGIPVYKPEDILPLDPAVIEKKLDMTFTSESVPGEDTLEIEFDPGETVEAENAYLSIQIKLIADNYDLWELETKSYRNQGTSYCVTDLDHNGRLEIISLTYGGTGLFEAFIIYEVNEKIDGLEKIFDNITESGQPEPDIGVTQLKTFVKNGEYRYLMTDVLRNGISEIYYSYEDFMLKKGKVTSSFVATRAELSPPPDYKTSYKYYGSDGKEITEDEYNRRISDFEHPTGMTYLNWIGYNEMKGNLVKALTSSWKGFSYVEGEPEQ